ncbi:MAG TPA: lysine 5,6-aminomutase subunit alpha [Solirubrobacteraceae bacterium]|jgi:beta-lysine 5,6-aminomutase alpha subunit|nr:lysine 5,6-aminomutase subunit alpha [Solirubrobacteraceae bacterium]
MDSKLDLDVGVIESCRRAAAQIADRIAEETAGKTTVSVERTVARFLGVDGINELDIPLPNVLVDHVRDGGGLGRGVAYWLGNAMLQTGRGPQEIAAAVSAGELELCGLPQAEDGAIRELVARACERRMGEVSRRMDERHTLRERLGEGPPPQRYVLTATGNVYEDLVHSVAVAETGGGVVSLTRSTAQSLLDYVPYGPTTEGYGGTFATQANFRILREGLDEWCERNGRYVRLSSFCSGLCMAEFATMGAMEGLDNMVNDALYGILYRDINMLRTLIDQRVSRMINGYFGIVINTGEDNYLRTADALEAAPSVTASQFINHQLALDSGMPDEQIALGDAFEIDPPTTNGLLYEWAQAQLTRELFPNCPVKFMPPTRHMDGNLYRTHACDTLFNLITIATGQGIQTAGVPTEGVFTPLLHDRVVGLECVDYVFNYARDIGEEIQFKPGGLIQTRAREVLGKAHELLERIAEVGMFRAIEDGTFGDVRRRIDEGRGMDGIIATEEGYFNPTVELMQGAGVA